MPAPLKYLDNPDCVETTLARWPDDRRFYKVEVMSRDEKRQQSLVKFEDGYIHPIDNKDLHIQLDLDKIGDEAICCCLCETDKSEAPNLIVICDLCQLGYHVGCHQPPIEQAFLDDTDEEWFCDTCLEITNPEKRKRTKANRDSLISRQSPRKPSSVVKKKRGPGSASKKSRSAQRKSSIKQEKTDESQNRDKADRRVVQFCEQIQEAHCDLTETEPCFEVTVLTSSSTDLPPLDPKLSEGLKVKELEDGSVIEEMNLAIVQSASDLAEIMKTEDFVASISPPPKPDIAKGKRSPKEKKPIKSYRAKKTPIKSNLTVKPEPA